MELNWAYTEVILKLSDENDGDVEGVKAMKQSYVLKVKRCCGIKRQKQVIDARFRVLVLTNNVLKSKASDGE